MTDLVDKVRKIETIRLNEEYVTRKQYITTPAVASVNAVHAAVGSSHYGASHSTQRYGKNLVQKNV